MPTSHLFDLSEKIAVVTGASSGLGQGAATLLAAHGAQVVAIARREDALKAWSTVAKGETSVLAADLSSRSTLADIAAEASRPFGTPDILINAAGINTRQAADDMTDAHWDLTQNLNVAAPFFLAKALVPGMRAKGWGRIINFASLQSRRAFANGISYGASKGAVEQMTRAMAEAWSCDGITANAIAPGFFRTELTAPVFDDPELSARNAAQTCIGRNGEVHDMDGPMMFFCSEASNYVTGQTLFVDGGYTAK